MKKNKTVKIIILFFLLISFINCETASDCIAGIKPNLISKELDVGAIFQHYNDTLTFEMINANTNDYLISEISVEGNLPPNINYNILNNSTINFSGIPNTKGTYAFTVKITVRPYIYNSDGTDDMCGNISSKKYKIIIN